MSIGVLLAVLCTTLLRSEGATTSRSVYVAINGDDRPDCGASTETPCASLRRALLETNSGDTIRIDATETASQPEWFCHEDPLLIHHSVTFLGFRGRAHIGCPQFGNRLLMFNITSVFVNESLYDASTTAIVIAFENLDISSGLFHAMHSRIAYRNCVLHDTKWVSMPGEHFVALTIEDSRWHGSIITSHGAGFPSTAELHIAARDLLIRIRNVTFILVKMTVVAGASVDFRLVDSSMIADPAVRASVHGGIYMTVADGTALSHIAVVNCVFSDQVHDDPVQSIMNLYESSLLFRVAYPKDTPSSNVSVLVDGVRFSDNERGLTLIGAFKETRVLNSMFYRNIAMHAGAAILYLTHPHTQSFVTNCTFEQSAAGSFRPAKLRRYESSFRVNGDEVRVHSECCKGLISFVGKGGAIRVQRGNLTLEDCRFENNTARLLGGAVFVDRESTVYITRAFFSNTPMHRHSMEGDIFYSNGRVTIHNARLLVHTAMNHVALLRHSGDHWSIEVSDVSVQCPVGYGLRLTNTSAYGVTAIGLRRSYKLDQLSYFCESCPQNKYSLDYGHMNYSLVYSEFAYYTLLINGQKPSAAYNGTYTYHDIECLQCPYGGRCRQTITAVPNFWGYVQGNRIKFQHCPKDYCCSSTFCRSYNNCADSRVGRLCGVCGPGFSEALFSARCLPDGECDVTWLWPLIVASGLLYATLLLFQKDIRDFVFLQPIHLRDIALPCWRRYDRPPCNNAVAGEGVANSLRENTELESLPRNGDVEQFDQVAHHRRRSSTTKKTSISPTTTTTTTTRPPVDTGASFLIIISYYFQDAQLLHLKTVFTSSENRSKNMLKQVLLGLFKFRVEIFQFTDKVCFFKQLKPSQKLMIKALLVPYVLLQFGAMYVIYQWWQRLRRRSTAAAAASDGTACDSRSRKVDPTKKTFLSKLATGFILSLLFTYQKLATTSFALLNCVPVGDDSVLFIEGTITCYRGWQYGVIVYVSLCIGPFCMVLLIGPGLLKDGLIPLKQFFCACFLPLPFLVYWVAMRLWLRGWRPDVVCSLGPEAQAVINVLQGPFKETDTRLFGSLCGAGVVIGRRLVLVLLYTFVNDTLVRMLAMMLVCFVILLHHMHALPYRDTRGNLAGSASAAALLMVGGINLVRAGFEAAEYVPMGPNAVLMQVFEEIENVLMLWFPAAVMGIIIMSLTVKIVLMLMKAAFPRRRRTTPTVAATETQGDSEDENQDLFSE